MINIQISGNNNHQFLIKIILCRSWYTNIQSSSPSSCSVMSSLLKDTETVPTSHHYSLLSPATVPEESLYKSDPARKSKSGKTSFTRQADIEEVEC